MENRTTKYMEDEVKYVRIMLALNERKKLLNDKGHEVVGVFLQGSQNYNLDYENSDIDCKAIIIPKFNDFALNRKQVSTTHIMDNNEHIDLKDIRIMLDNIKKQNINFVEILFTPYTILNNDYSQLFKPLLDNNELIARYDILTSIKSMVGMCYEKYKALEHPYPNTIEQIKKFGYSGKQLHHILRIQEFLERYVEGESYKDCLISRNPEYLINVKRSCHTLEEARTLAKESCDAVYAIREKYRDYSGGVNEEVGKLIDEVKVNIIKEGFIKELSLNGI